MPLICVILARLPQCLGGVASVPRYRCLQASFSSLNCIDLLVVFFHHPILKKRPPWIFLKFMFICLLFFVIFFLPPTSGREPSFRSRKMRGTGGFSGSACGHSCCTSFSRSWSNARDGEDPEADGKPSGTTGPGHRS